MSPFIMSPFIASSFIRSSIRAGVISICLGAGLIAASSAFAAGGGSDGSSSSGGSSTKSCSGAPAREATTYCTAVAQVESQNYAKAEALLRKVLREEPKHANTLNYLGFVIRKQGHLNEALDYYQQALAIEPNHLGANEYLGELYLQMKDVTKAKERLAVLKAACGDCEEYEDLKKQIASFKG